MQKSNYKIRTMTQEEVALAIEWAAKEGWNPGLYDGDCFYEADQNAFLVGLLDGEPIATISATRYGESFGFLGFYIVRPEYRGRGYGIQIWNQGLKYLEGRNIGLDGVVAQQDNYKKSGFKLAYRNVRYEGYGGGDAPESTEIIKLSELAFETITTYDQLFFPENRTSFIKSWINQTGCNALGIIQNGKLAGYGVMRKCRFGYKIGPLFAASPELAATLFLSLKAGIKATDLFYLDTPEVNHAAVTLAKSNNMKVVFETARMYTGTQPDIPLKQIFGVTSFELG